MTIKETKLSREEWIKSIKVGDEVCVTNSYNISVMLGFSLEAFTGKNENTAPREICEIKNVRGILEDGAIIVDDTVYKPDGTPENKEDKNAPELYPVTDELREKMWRLKFSNDIKNIDWSKVSSDGIEKIIDIINDEIKRIEAETKAKWNEEELFKAKERARFISSNPTIPYWHAKDETRHNLPVDEAEETNEGGENK